MKIFIAIPCLDKLDVEFVKSLEHLHRIGSVSVNFASSSLVYDSRDKLSVLAVENKSDYVLWLDSDMVFDSDMLIDMMKDIEDNKIDFVAGIFVSRRPPFAPCIWKDLRMGIAKDDQIAERYLDYPKEQLFPIEGCGMAAVLMKTEMLETVINAERTAFQPLPGYGEDVSFCIRARKHGYKLYCDSKIKVGHIAQAIVDENSYEAWKLTTEAK